MTYTDVDIFWPNQDFHNLYFHVRNFELNKFQFYLITYKYIYIVVMYLLVLKIQTLLHDEPSMWAGKATLI